MKIRYYYDSLYPVYFLSESALHAEQEIEISEDLLCRYEKVMSEFGNVQKETQQEIKNQKNPVIPPNS